MNKFPMIYKHSKFEKPFSSGSQPFSNLFCGLTTPPPQEGIDCNFQAALEVEEQERERKMCLLGQKFLARG